MTNFWIGFLYGVGSTFLGSFLILALLYFRDVGRNLDDKEIQESNSERQDTHSVN